MIRHFAFSDIHGNYALFKKIKKFLAPQDICYVLGDCADRGENGYEIIKEVLKDKRFVYIKGNHEDLFTTTIQTNSRDYYICWMQNGGEPTLIAYEEDDSPSDIIKKLSQLPLKSEYTNPDGITYFMSHAGFLFSMPEAQRDYLWDREHFKLKDNIGNNFRVIHGHTPIKYMSSKKIDSGVFLYNDNKKINIDCGTAVTHRIALYDLDNYSTIDFYDRG